MANLLQLHHLIALLRVLLRQIEADVLAGVVLVGQQHLHQLFGGPDRLGVASVALIDKSVGAKNDLLIALTIIDIARLLDVRRVLSHDLPDVPRQLGVHGPGGVHEHAIRRVLLRKHLQNTHSNNLNEHTTQNHAYTRTYRHGHAG